MGIEHKELPPKNKAPLFEATSEINFLESSCHQVLPLWSLLSGKASPATVLPRERARLRHLAKYADGFLLLGYCVELFKDLESSAG